MDQGARDSFTMKPLKLLNLRSRTWVLAWTRLKLKPFTYQNMQRNNEQETNNNNNHVFRSNCTGTKSGPGARRQAASVLMRCTLGKSSSIFGGADACGSFGECTASEAEPSL